MSKHTHPAIHVAATRENFRRAGHVFGTQPKTIALGALHPDAHAAILADKSLVVVNTAVYLDEAETAALPHRDAPHVMHAAARLDSLPVSVDEDHAKRAMALADIEAELKQRSDALDEREANVEGAELALNERKAAVERAQADLETQRAAFDQERAAFDQERAAFEAARHVGAESVSQNGSKKR
ncbi:hypothetical protein [Paraburkholderia humisilvae]|uniref:KfrA N-terminal DNA-binding domain-containing protein n=1 Tax=Paraburkholderia humisilvae TaxID=627669 RepID=A0A6J5EGF6_9BURK|nr:hypothetical protein [Paraburkholderia humisilvae]CAB3764125.1 hypothetical protein LMG29542_04786 [Paraburkholderia humisilvae]